MRTEIAWSLRTVWLAVAVGQPVSESWLRKECLRTSSLPLLTCLSYAKSKHHRGWIRDDEGMNHTLAVEAHRKWRKCNAGRYGYPVPPEFGEKAHLICLDCPVGRFSFSSGISRLSSTSASIASQSTKEAVVASPGIQACVRCSGGGGRSKRSLPPCPVPTWYPTHFPTATPTTRFPTGSPTTPPTSPTYVPTMATFVPTRAPSSAPTKPSLFDILRAAQCKHAGWSACRYDCNGARTNVVINLSPSNFDFIIHSQPTVQINSDL
jgi:hypothetical protein